MWILPKEQRRFASLRQAFHLLRPNHHRLIPAPEGDWSRLVDLAQVCFPSLPFSGQLRGISMSKHVKTCQKCRCCLVKPCFKAQSDRQDLFRLTEYRLSCGVPTQPPIAPSGEHTGVVWSPSDISDLAASGGANDGICHAMPPCHDLIWSVYLCESMQSMHRTQGHMKYAVYPVYPSATNLSLARDTLGTCWQ